MSTKTTPFAKTKHLYTAVIVALATTSTGSYAVNFGKTSIQSKQYQPLSATIAVNDIDGKKFNVSLANSAIYQQMGLTANGNITATFQRTSANSGKIILKSSQPINEPFADIVLDINNSDKKQFMPKTLLMPMADNAKVNLKPQNVVASTSSPKLPTTTPIAPSEPAAIPESAAKAVTDKQPSTEKTPVPSVPAIAAQTSIQAPATSAVTTESTSQPSTSKGIPDGEFAEATRQAFLADQAKGKQLAMAESKAKKATDDLAKTDNNQPKQQSAEKPSADASIIAQSDDAISNKKASSVAPQTVAKSKNNPTTSSNNQSKDNANSKNSSKNNLEAKSNLEANNNVEDKNKQTSENSSKVELTTKKPSVPNKANEPEIGKLKADRLLLDDLKQLKAEQSKKQAKKAPNKPTNKKSTKPQQAKNTEKPVENVVASGKATYVVQRNDNLWTIANEIARRNKSNVHTVMKQIQQHNPTAFVDGNASRLIANKTLVLPDYDVVPSQRSLQEAIAAKRSSTSSKKTASKASNTTAKNKGSGSKNKAKPSKSKSRYTAKTKKSTPKSSHQTMKKQVKPRVSLVAPDASKKATTKKSTGGSNNQLVARLKKSRQSTAKHASRIRKLNNQVGSYTQKLQLQNKKLAQLEARLKKLKGEK